MSFNFSGFKKVGEDAQTFTMQHPSGHQMRIIKSAIPKIQQQQLKLLPLAKGGEVEGISTQGKDVRNAKKAKARGREADAVMDLELAKEEAKGRADHERMIKPKMKGLNEGGKVKYYNEDGAVESDNNSDDQTSANQTPAQAPVTVNVQSSPAAQPAPNPAVAQAAAPINVEQPNIPTPAPNLNPNGSMNPAAINENIEKGSQLTRESDIAQGKAMADINQSYTQAIAQNEQRRQNYLGDLNKHTEEFGHYINDPKTKLNPDAYRENMSSGSKVAAAFGMLLGGLGTPFGGVNYAQQFLNQQIDRDISAQKDRAQQQQTLLGAYQHLYGDNIAAVNATKASMLDIYNQQAKQVALKLNTPRAYQAYLQYSTSNLLEKNKLLQDAAVNLNDLPGTRSLHGNGPLRDQPQPQNQQQGGGNGASNNTEQKGIIMDRLMSGILPQAEAEETPKDKQKSEQDYYENHILVPGAARVLQGIQYRPKLRDKFGEINDQYKKAQATEALLQSVDSKFKDIKSERNLPGAIASEINPHAMGATLAPAGGVLAGAAAAGMLGTNPITVPIAGVGVPAAAGLGAAAGATVGEGLGYGGKWLFGKLGGQSERQFQSDKGALEKDLFAALSKTNASNDTIKDILEKNLPEYADSEATMTKKLRNIKEFIKLSTAGDRSLLEIANLTPGKRLP